MPTTVRVDEATKRELDRLQGLVQAETGQRLTHTELLSRLLGVARRHPAEVLHQREWTPPSPAELKRILDRVPDFGVRASARRIEEVLYGGSPHE